MYVELFRVIFIFVGFTLSGTILSKNMSLGAEELNSENLRRWQLAEVQRRLRSVLQLQ
jgi:hypothetical protein